MIKKVLILTLLFAILVGTFLNFGTLQASADTNDIDSLLTVEEYKAFLFKEDRSVLQQFSALSNEEQEEFVAALNDPETYENEENWEISETTELENVEKNNDVGIQSTTRTYSRHRNYNMTIAGITVTGYRISIRFESKNGRVSRILSRSATVERRLNPMVQTSRTSLNSYISNNRAYVDATFHYSVGPIQNLSKQIGTLAANGSWRANGSLYSISWRRR